MNLLEKIKWHEQDFIKHHYPYLWNRRLSRKVLGKVTDYSHPRDINEKIQWLMFHTDTTLWTTLADKYAVREYVRERIGEQYLVPLLGKWDRSEDIDFDSLPQKFVMKPNNGSYDCVVVKNKSAADLDDIRGRMDFSLRHSFGYENAEPHYLRIRPCIIAEQMLETDQREGLVDYKIWCFDGKPYCFFICSERDVVTHQVHFNYYDLEWKRHPEYMSEKFRNDAVCPQPENMEEMLAAAARLSKGLPQARVDFYNIRGKIYFGEMTMSSNFGMMPYYTQEVLNEMGKQCVLPTRTLKEQATAFFRRWLPTII